MGIAKHPKPATVKSLELAAQMRVEGKTWAEIAPYINRKNGKLASHLPHEHPTIWHQFHDAALAARLDEIEAKATKTLLDLLDEDDLMIRERAAHSLLRHCSTLRTKKSFVTKISQTISTKRAEEMTYNEMQSTVQHVLSGEALPPPALPEPAESINDDNKSVNVNDNNSSSSKNNNNTIVTATVSNPDDNDNDDDDNVPE